MAFHKYVGNFRSSNGKNRIAYYVYEPECVVQGIVQISHGMCEYLEMYEELIGVLCDHGLLVCGNDHLGHGNSVSSEEDFGYFGEKDGWICLVKDLKKMNGYIRKEYPDVPCFLLGHSMGSFVARLYTSFYGDSIDGAIFLGTSGKIRGLVGALGILRGYRKVRDDRYRSEMINQIAFGTYNRRYRDEKDDFSWLCHSEEFRKQYVTEERNRFIFTLGGLTDLVSLLYYISQKKWYEKIPKELPFLLMGGTEDPVGQYGKGIREVCRKMKKAGCQDVTMQLYPGRI
jgi:alpha-beta hydrolase superfamily lysophospholipase